MANGVCGQVPSSIHPSFFSSFLPFFLLPTHPSSYQLSIYPLTSIYPCTHLSVTSIHLPVHLPIYTLIHPPTHPPTHPSITQTHTGHLLSVRHHTQHTQITSLMERTIYRSKETCRQTTPPAAWVASRDRQMQRE